MKYLKKYNESFFPAGSDFGKSDWYEDQSKRHERAKRQELEKQELDKQNFLLKNKDLIENIKNDMEDYLLHLKESLFYNVVVEHIISDNIDNLYFKIRIDIDKGLNVEQSFANAFHYNRVQVFDFGSIVGYGENVKEVLEEIKLFKSRIEKYKIISIECSIDMHNLILMIAIPPI